MGYTIFTRLQVEPRTITVHGENDTTHDVLNAGYPPVYPAGASVHYTPPDLDIYSAVASARKVLLLDPKGSATSDEIFKAFPDIRDVKAKEIREGGDYRLGLVPGDYMEKEQKTWTLQQARAQEWLADNKAPCIILRTMAATRGITIEEMVKNVMSNANPFEEAIGQILGYQQRLLDMVYGATDYDQMLSIKW